MVYLILLGLLFFMQLLTASWYDLVQKTAADRKKIFKHRMLCSGIYIACVLLCTVIGAGFTDLFALMFTGAFFLLFISDALESFEKELIKFISVFLRFSGYLVMAIALIIKSKELFEEPFMSTRLGLIIAFACSIICIVLDSIKMHHIPPLIALLYLLANAILTGIPLHRSGEPMMQAASCALIMGAVALAISNTLSVFDKNNQKSLLRINLYYFGLMFISCSVAVL